MAYRLFYCNCFCYLPDREKGRCALVRLVLLMDSERRCDDPGDARLIAAPLTMKPGQAETERLADISR